MYVNARFLTQRVTGVQRFAREVTRVSVEKGLWTPADTRFLAPVAEEIPDRFEGLEVTRVGRHGGHRWEQLELPRAAKDDLLLNLCNTAPMFNRQQVVMLHDAAVAALPQNFTAAFRLWYAVMIRGYGRSARRIGTISHYSADELVRHFGLRRDRIEVIPLSGEHILDQQPDYSLHEQHGLEQDGYILAVSSVAPHKNFARLAEAMARLPDLPYKFVVVGGRNNRVFNGREIDLKGAVEVGYATDAQLRALYERAACFVYPSLYEGFGLPPVEAMCCGCPVLVSTATCLPEICGDGAAYCDPYDPDDIARQIVRLLESPAARQDLREAGRQRAKMWTWEGCARRLREIADASVG